MPVLKGSLIDVSASPSSASEVWVRAPRGRVTGQRVIVPEAHRVPVDGGEFSVNVEPGQAYLVVVHAGAPQEHVPLLVTGGMTTVAEAVRLGDESWKDFTPSQAEQIKAEVAASVAAAAAASEAAGRYLKLVEAAKSEAVGAATRAGEASGEASAQATVAKTAATGAATSEANAKASEVDAKQSADRAANAEREAASSAASAKQDADRAESVASSTSWDGDKLTVNGQTSPSLTGPPGPAGQDGATTWDAVSGKPDTYPPTSHKHVKADITDLPAIAQTATGSTLMQRDSAGRVQVGTPSSANDAATKAYVDTADGTLSTRIDQKIQVVSSAPSSPTAGVLYVITE